MKDKKYKYLIACTFVIRILIQLGIPLQMHGNSMHDDMLMVNYSKSILEIGWLGEYSDLTLNKVPGFGIFLAVLKILNIPYMLGVIILYCFGAFLFLIVIHKIINNKYIAYLLFLFVLFSPVMFDMQIVQRVYRMSIIPGVVLIIISSYLGIFVERKNGWKKKIRWVLCAGVNLAFFYIIREDAIWFSCFIFGATVLLSVLFVVENISMLHKKKCIMEFLFLFIPIGMALLSTNIIKLT